MTNNVVTEVNVKVPITKQRISDLLCCAFEGGSNYWYMIKKSKKPAKLEFRSNEEVVFFHLDYPLNEGGNLTITDQEDNNKAYVLDLDSITKGIQVMAEKYPRHFADMVSEDFDATTGDVFLQCCLFGEVIYA